MVRLIVSIFFLLTYVLVSDGAKNSKITPPKRLSRGETPVLAPGWKHCVTDNMKAGLSWKQLKSPDYPKLPKTQMQCSWIMEAPIGWRIKIAFRDLNLGTSSTCRSAYVDVIDTKAQKSQGRFCGNKPPGDYVSIDTGLRIDLQGDKSRIVHRGFLISYKAVKEAPGFRAKSSLATSSKSAPGKVNFNEFKSTQQRNINSANKSKRKPRPAGSKRLVYASDQKFTKPVSTTTRRPLSGWAGDDSILQPTSTRAPTGPKVAFRSTPKTQSNRISAIDHAPQNNNNDNNQKNNNDNNNSGIRISHQANNNGNGKNGDEQGDTIGLSIYGENMQPGGRKIQQEWISSSKENSGLSTINLIIIVVASIVGCLLITLAAFLLKRFYFDKRSKKKKKKKEERQQNIEMNKQSMHRATSLPGLSRAGSVHSHHSRISFRPEHIEEQRRISRLNSRQQMPPRHSMESLRRHEHSFSHNKMSRHQSLVAQHNAIYNNHHTVAMHAKHGPQRLISQQQRLRAASLKRPLPAIPKQQNNKTKDIDEDYCSGSDEDPDVMTMRRELSPWEIEQQKKRRFRPL